MGTYTVELVGESNYQAAIARLTPNDRVKLVPEPDNAFDPRAVRCVNIAGETLGYLERDGWLTRAMLDDGTAVASRIKDIVGGVRGKPSRGIVLEVLTAGEAEAALARSAAAAEQPAAPSPVKSGMGCGKMILIGLALLIGLVVLGSLLPKPAKETGLSASVAAPGEHAAPAVNDPEITADEFAQLRNGISHEEAARIIGSPGELISEVGLGGVHTVMYQWKGNTFVANANATFQNDKLISKAQLGLQ